jgi:Uma2 family endonuclease
MRVLAMAVAVRPRLFTVEEYHAMGEAGVFAPGERVELLDGEILTMAPIGPRHIGVVNRLTHLLVTRFGSKAIVQVQNPVRLSNLSEPQPDIVLLRRRDDFYAARHAQPTDTLALVEVAQSSLAYDRERKRKAYACSGITEYWIVNLNSDEIEIYRRPSSSDYEVQSRAARGESVAFEAFPDEPLSADDVLVRAQSE